MFLCLGWFELSNDGYSGRCPVNEKEVVMASADDMNLIAYNYPVDVWTAKDITSRIRLICDYTNGCVAQ